MLSDQSDILFMLDTSSSVYELDFEKMKIFLSDFIDLFNVSKYRQRVSSLTFADDIKVNFYLDDHLTNEEVKVDMIMHYLLNYLFINLI